MFAVLDIHRRKLRPGVTFEVKESIETKIPFLKTDGSAIKADLQLVLGDHSLAIAGEAVGARDASNADRHTIAHGRVRDLFGRNEPQAAYLGQKVMCQLFPAVLDLRMRGIAEPNIVAYYAVAKDHPLNPQDALIRLRNSDLIQPCLAIQMPQSFPLRIYRIKFGGLDDVLTRLGGDRARFRQ